MSMSFTEYTPDGAVVAPGATWERLPIKFPAMAIVTVVHAAKPISFIAKVVVGGETLLETRPYGAPDQARNAAEAEITARLVGLLRGAAAGSKSDAAS